MEQELEKDTMRNDSSTLTHSEDRHLQSNANIASQIQEVLERLQQNQILMPQPGEVRDYLLRFFDIVDLLQPVCESAREKFGAGTQLSLEVYRDPEINDEYVTLYARQKNYDAKIMDTIEKISSEFDEKLTKSSGWLLLTTDFNPPR